MLVEPQEEGTRQRALTSWLDTGTSVVDPNTNRPLDNHYLHQSSLSTENWLRFKGDRFVRGSPKNSTC